jgi:hypothetical protein
MSDAEFDDLVKQIEKMNYRKYTVKHYAR